MQGPDIFRMYDRFGNLFGLTVQQGMLYQLDGPPSPHEKAKTIYYDGKYFTPGSKEGLQPIEVTLPMLMRLVTKQFVLGLKEAGYCLKGRYIVYREQDELDQPCKDIFCIYDGFEFRVVNLTNGILLCVDPHLIFRSNCTIGQLLEKGMSPADLSDFSVNYRREERYRIDGYLIETRISDSGQALCKVKNYRDFKQEDVPAENVLPEPKPELIQRVLEHLSRRFNVIALQRKQSFLDSFTASRDRLMRTLAIITELRRNVFPLRFGKFKVSLDSEPVVIRV